MPCESGPTRNYAVDLTKVTRLLCEACRLLDTLKNNSLNQASPELQTWWKNHQEQDKARRTREKLLKQQAKAVRKKQYEELKKEFE